MKIENGHEFIVTDELTIVTENGWNINFYRKLFDVFMGNKKILSGMSIKVLDNGLSVPSGIDTLILTKQTNGKIKLTEKTTITDY